MHGIVGDKAHALHIGLPVGCEILLKAVYSNDFGHDIVAGFGGVELLLDAALHGHGEAVEEGGIHMRRQGGFPAGAFHLLGVVTGAHQPHVVGGHEGGLRGESKREVAATVQVGRGGVCSHRYHYLVLVPLSAPCGVHGVGSSVGIICSYDQHGLGEHPCMRREFFHLGAGLVPAGG